MRGKGDLWGNTPGALYEEGRELKYNSNVVGTNGQEILQEDS